MRPDNLWINPLCNIIDLPGKGPFLKLADGRFVTVDDEGLLVSSDGGKIWSERLPAALGQGPSEPNSCMILEPEPNLLVMVYLNRKDPMGKFSWDNEKVAPADDCRMEVMTARSVDGGKTWSEPQRLQAGYNANFFGFIKTSTGRIIVAQEHLTDDPARWIVATFYSDDLGQTWKRSNWIDMGGHGHHDGSLEPSIVELKDGRLLLWIRTNHGKFWQAFSEDDGRYWRKLEPTEVAASSAPGMIIRLASGRIALVYNQLGPKGEPDVPLKELNINASEVQTSWYREELVISFSEDEAGTWSEPFVLGRMPGSQLSYPYILEPEPGKLWIIPGFASAVWFNTEPFPLALEVAERDALIP